MPGHRRRACDLKISKITLSKRSIAILVLLAVIGFYAFGTGFNFFYRFFYALILLLSLGAVWSWLGLQGIDLKLFRTATRGTVGGYLVGRIRFRNRIRLPKSWLEVIEVTDLPDPSTGRGLAVIGDQVRVWRTETYLSRRGVFQTGRLEVTSQDPFGLFRQRRRFLDAKTVTVLPAAQPLPDMDPLLANLPSDGRITRHWDHITTDVASIRHYNEGDSYRRIHWPYTARMNSLMVKEFDMGLSAESWVVVDMDAKVHVGADTDATVNTEETAVTVAASLINRFADFSLPVGLAANGDNRHVHRPNTSPEYPGRLMEVLAIVRALGTVGLERFLYDLGPSFSRFNTLTVVTPSSQTGWVPAIGELRRQGVNVSVVMIDPQDFGEAPGLEPVFQALEANDVASYLVRKGISLNDCLRSPVSRSVSVTAVSSPTGWGGAA